MRSPGISWEIREIALWNSWVMFLCHHHPETPVDASYLEGKALRPSFYAVFIFFHEPLTSGTWFPHLKNEDDNGRLSHLLILNVKQNIAAQTLSLLSKHNWFVTEYVAETSR
jgi:hypothetical protein